MDALRQPFGVPGRDCVAGGGIDDDARAAGTERIRHRIQRGRDADARHRHAQGHAALVADRAPAVGDVHQLQAAAERGALPALQPRQHRAAHRARAE